MGDDDDSHTQYTTRGIHIKLHMKGNALVMRTKISPPGEGGSNHGERKEDARVLGDSGFTPQEEVRGHRHAPP